MKGSEFVLEYVHLLYYKCHKLNLNRGGLYIDSTDSIKKQKTAINPINKKDSKCFQYTVTVELSHEKVKNESQVITKVKPFINKYN